MSKGNNESSRRATAAPATAATTPTTPTSSSYPKPLRFTTGGGYY